MNDIHAETLSKPTLLAAEPQLFVADIGTSCEFYTKKARVYRGLHLW
jgi:hypothetical protein